VYGQRRTWKGILAYSAALVLSTLLPVLFQSAGPVFLGAAILLGGVLFATMGGGRSAFRLYRFLSLYLGLLLAASAVDALLRAPA
jgi:heme O synthase-like polyprenyltransferase